MGKEFYHTVKAHKAKVEELEQLLVEACERLSTKTLYLERFAPKFEQDDSFFDNPKIKKLLKEQK